MTSKSKKIIARLIDGEVIILNLETGIYYSLDKIGTDVWNLIDERRSEETIAKKIATRYKVSKEKAECDISKLIKELSKEKLVKIADSKIKKR